MSGDKNRMVLLLDGRLGTAISRWGWEHVIVQTTEKYCSGPHYDTPPTGKLLWQKDDLQELLVPIHHLEKVGKWR